MAIPICPTDCGTPLPVMSFNEFCDPCFFASEIQYLLIAKGTAAPIADLSSSAEWSARISNTSTDDNAIRRVIVIGDIPASTQQEYVGSLQRRKVLSRTQTLNFDVDDTCDQTYEAFRALQCGGSVMVWAVTKSGHLLGGSFGLGEGKPVTITVNFLFNRGEAEVQRIQAVLTWEGLFSPQRSIWVLSGTAGQGAIFSTTLTFSAATTDTDSGVTGTVAAVNTTQTFEFNNILAPAGTPNSMVINVGGVQAATIDFPSDYAGTAFRYTHTNGTVYSGTFINGTVNF